MDCEREGTFDRDDSLPSLPLPPLEHTLRRYLDSVKPFANSEQEYRNTEKIVQTFMNGDGAVLHSKLVERAQQHKNWVEKWWEDYAYLISREPLVPHSSMVGVHALPIHTNQLMCAAAYCHQMVRLWRLLRQERLPPSTNRQSQPLSMDQYRRLFNCSVTPHLVKDPINTHFRTEKEGPCSSLVVLLCNANMFVMDSLQPDGQLLTPGQWEHQLQLIQEQAAARRGAGVSYLACDQRDSWAKNRQHLLGLSSDNAEILAMLEDAMFVVCLDSDRPDPDCVSHQLLCGDYSCRWPDHANNFVFFSNGLSGTLSLHSAFDGIVGGSATLFARHQITNSQRDSQADTRPLPEPRQLQFVLDSHILSQITIAKGVQESEKMKVLMCQEEFKLFGKQRIKSVNIHPDSFIQMALQLAYYRMHKRPGSCYETATTRRFYRGRTETVRSCTDECLRWVHSMDNPQSSSSSRWWLLQGAVHKHDQLMSEACGGHGYDRHLFGLYCVVLDNNLQIPAIFTDPLFTKSGGGGNFELSTSLLGYIPAHGGVTPMCHNGYGIFYSIGPDCLMFTISVRRGSTETSANKMFANISEALQDVISLAESQAPSKL